MNSTDITVTVTREVANALCAQAGILIHDDGHDGPELPGVPQGVYYDTNSDRWTWALGEATRWATVILAENDR